MQAQIARRVQILLTLAILVAATYLFGVAWTFLSQFLGTFMLFFLAWILAYLLKPLVTRMTGAGLPLWVAVLLVYIIGPAVALVLGYLLVPTIVDQVNRINDHLDEYIGKVSGLVDDLMGVLTSFGVSASDLQALGNSIEASVRSGGQAALHGVANTLGGIADVLFRIGLVLIFSISFLMNGDKMASEARAALPERWREGATLVIKSIEESFGSFVRGQLFSALAYALMTAAVMVAFGLPDVALSSLAAGLFVILPLIGNYLAYLPPLLACLIARPDQTLTLLVVLVIVQGLYMNIIDPRIMAKAVNMDPLVTIASILIFGQLWGFWGALFGIPIASTIGMLAPHAMQLMQSYLSPTGDTGDTDDPQSNAQPEPQAAFVPQANVANGMGDQGKRAGVPQS